jgi:hypothetical protein
MKKSDLPDEAFLDEQWHRRSGSREVVLGFDQGGSSWKSHYCWVIPKFKCSMCIEEYKSISSVVSPWDWGNTFLFQSCTWWNLGNTFVCVDTHSETEKILHSRFDSHMVRPKKYSGIDSNFALFVGWQATILIFYLGAKFILHREPWSNTIMDYCSTTPQPSTERKCFHWLFSLSSLFEMTLFQMFYPRGFGLHFGKQMQGYVIQKSQTSRVQ